MTEKKILGGEIGEKERDLKRAESLTQKGIELAEKGNFKESKPLLLEAQILWEKWEQRNVLLADVYETLGTCDYYEGKFEEALDFYQKNLSIRLPLLGERHPSVFISYRSISNVYGGMAKYDEALAVCKHALQLALKSEPKNKRELAITYRELAYVYSLKMDIDKSLENNLKALKLLEILSPTIDFDIAVVYNNIADMLKLKGDSFSALDYLFKVEAFLVQNPNTYPMLAAVVYANIGEIYSHAKKVQKSEYYFQKALNNPSLSYDSIANFYKRYAQLCLRIGDYAKAQHYLEKANQGVSKENYRKRIQILSDFGKLYECTQQYQIAESYYQKALQLINDAENQYSIEGYQTYYVFGKYLLERGRLEEAKKHFEISLKLYQGLSSEKNTHLAVTYYELSKLHQKQKETFQALTYAQDSIIQCLSDYSNKSIFEKLPIEEILTQPQKTLNIRGLLLNVQQKAALFLDVYKDSKQKTQFLQSALENYQTLFTLLEHFRKFHLSNDEKLQFSKDYQDAYHKAIETVLIHHHLWRDEKFLHLAFDISEKGRAYLMLSQFKDRQAKAYSAIPNNLLEEERQIKLQIRYLEKSIQKAQQKKDWSDEKLLKRWEEEYVVQRYEFEEFLKQLETDYPEYYRQKYSTETVSIEALQSSLQENQTVLSYFIGEEKIYLFAITADEYEVFTQDKPNNWTKLVQDYLQSIKLHQKTEFHRYSFELYQTLLQEVMHHIIDPFAEDDDQKQVFIIPHAELHYLPFETLIISEGTPSMPYNKMDYLLNHCQISYHYSATLLYLDLQKQSNAIAESAPADFAFTGFAPVYESTLGSQKLAIQQLQNKEEAYATAVNHSEAVRSDGTWVPLPYSKIEVENIVQLFEEQGHKSQKFLYESATKNNLERQIGKSRFVLIAAHGIVNDEYPELSGLVFSSQKQEERSEMRDISSDEIVPSSRFSPPTSHTDCILNMKEVAMIPMSADLVVLSSCESGIGELHKGEGMMAVNRGFLASGAKNVVSTLFKVNDKASCELTQLFFTHILKSLSRDLGSETYSTALQKAKLELLQGEGVSPKTWSGFVLFGTGS